MRASLSGVEEGGGGGEEEEADDFDGVAVMRAGGVGVDSQREGASGGKIGVPMSMPPANWTIVRASGDVREVVSGATAGVNTRFEEVG
mmetsp:Transcript_16575/g.33039  ORF Transcript_16575/g.33039 Transcript_16575/m.33039 type:complete len:88 (-) Transcript_16575:218-481(-)